MFDHRHAITLGAACGGVRSRTRNCLGEGEPEPGRAKQDKKLPWVRVSLARLSAWDSYVTELHVEDMAQRFADAIGQSCGGDVVHFRLPQGARSNARKRDLAAHACDSLCRSCGNPRATAGAVGR